MKRRLRNRRGRERKLGSKWSVSDKLSICGVLAASMLGAFQGYVLYEQTQIMGRQSDISERQAELLDSQTKLIETSAKISDSNSRPVVVYTRSPDLDIKWYDDPSKTRIRFSYPEWSKFSILSGVGAIVSASYSFNAFLTYGKDCPFNAGKEFNATARVFVDAGIVMGPHFFGSSRVERGLEKDGRGGWSVVSKGIKERISKVKGRINSNSSGCVGEINVYANYDVTIVDAFSQESHVYFTGPVFGSLTLTSKEIYEREVRRRYDCTLGFSELGAQECAKFISTKLDALQ